MATNEFGQTYEGNDDFRGWLAAGNADNMWREDIPGVNGTLNTRLLDVVGNDGRVDYNKVGSWGDQYQKAADYYYNRWLSERKSPQDTGTYYDPDAAAKAAKAAEEERQRQEQLKYWNGAIQRQENELNGLNGLQNELNAGTDSEYNQRNNELQTSYDRSKSDYDLGSRQNSQQLQTNKNTIADRSSQGLRGLLRTLGAMGAGGSSAALYNAPELVTAQANQERAGADQTFGENQQKLDKNWYNFKADWDNDKKKLEDWKQGQYRQNEETVLNKRNSILGQLMDAYAQRAGLGEGSGNKIDELTNQMMGNQNRINELNKFVKPSYDGTRATYSAPSLSSYNTGKSSISTQVSNAPQTGFSANNSPTLAMLLGVKDRKNSNPYGRE